MSNRTRDDLTVSSHRNHGKGGNVVNGLEVYFEQYQIFVICFRIFPFNLEVLALSHTCYDTYNQ